MPKDIGKTGSFPMTAALKILFLLAGLGFRFAAHAADAPLAVVDGVAISSEEIEKSLAGQLSKLDDGMMGS